MLKSKKLIALLAATCVSVSGLPVMNAVNVMAAGPSYVPEGAFEGKGDYKYVWGDEFEGSSLDTSMWTVEEHEKGWVNNELQTYVKSDDNIKVEDGKLKLIPIRNEQSTGIGENLLSNADFSNDMTGWDETIANWGEGWSAVASSSTGDGKIVYDINNSGDDVWHVQLKHNLSLIKGKVYEVKLTVNSTVARTFETGVQHNGENDEGFENYEGYAFGGSDAENKTNSLEANVDSIIEYEFTMPKNDDKACIYFSMGKFGEEVVGSHKITISNISVVEKPSTNLANNLQVSIAEASWGGVGENAPEASYEILEDGSYKFKIDKAGADRWHVQMKNPLKLKSGADYAVEFKALSTIGRVIGTSVQHDGTDGDYSSYGDGEYPWLNANEETTVSYDINVNDSGENIYFQISLGAASAEAKDTLEPHYVTISDVSIVEKTEDGGEIPIEYSYTSGRISTKGTANQFTYGYFETRAKVPQGAGFLPAFWLMTENESKYGQWPVCGEIDCMEVMGQNPNKLYGTIHYGNPHKENQGTKVVGTNLSEDFHTYGCEWLPGKIIWYLDGEKYFETNDWYSTVEGVGTKTYPAPFDHPFYIILNLAVGGSWVGAPDEDTFDTNNNFEVDYVRVFQKDEYNEDVDAPEKAPVHFAEADESGNFIKNSKFADTTENITAEDAANWKFMNAAGGVASASFVGGGDSDHATALKIATTNSGTELHSVQLVQPNLSFYKGAEYKVSFDAKTESTPRTMQVDIKAHERGWVTYMPTKVAAMTSEWQHFEQTFTMQKTTDPNARIEFNLGANDSTETVYITNVRLEYVDPDYEYDPAEDNKKTVLENGNYVYNGTFDEGNRHLGDWEVLSGNAVKNGVTPEKDGRRFKAEMEANAQEPLKLIQRDLAFTEGRSYQFSIDLQAENTAKVDINVGGVKKNIDVTDENLTYTMKIGDSAKFTNKNVEITVHNGTVFIDNVKLVEDSLIKNSSFNDGMSSYKFYVDSNDYASAAVDSLHNDNSLEVTINKTGDADWKVQLKQNNVNLEKGKKYELSFDAKSTMDRKIRVIMQGMEDRGYPNYSHTEAEGDGVVDVTSQWKTYTHVFTMEHESDPAAYLSVCLGKLDEEINERHVVTLDNFILKEYSPKDETGIIETEKVAVVFDPKAESAKGNNTDTIELGKVVKNGKIANTITKLTVDPALTGTVTVIKGSTITTATALDAAPTSDKADVVKVKYNKGKKIAMFKAAKKGVATIDYGNGHKLTINVTEPKVSTKSVKAAAGGAPVEITVDGDIDTYAWKVDGKNNEKAADGSIIVKDKKGNVVATVVTSKNVAKVIPGAVKGNVKVSAVYLNKKYTAKVKISDK